MKTKKKEDCEELNLFQIENYIDKHKFNFLVALLSNLNYGLYAKAKYDSRKRPDFEKVIDTEEYEYGVLIKTARMGYFPVEDCKLKIKKLK